MTAEKTHHDCKVLVYHPSVAHRYLERLKRAGLENVVAASSPEEAKTWLPEVDVLFSWGLPGHLLPEAKRLKWIQNMGAGVDGYLFGDNEFPANVLLTRVVDQYGGPMAEYVWSYLLYITKALPRLMEQQQERRWKPFIPETLRGKTVGVAGLGSIGAEMVRKARAFDMTVYGLSMSGTHAKLVDKHFLPNEWAEFVRDLDFLVLILPLTEHTHHVVNAEVFAAMKKDAVLVNVGRGKLVDEFALVRALQAGELRAAILDVFEQEPLPEDHPLWTLPNVYLTPHMSGLSDFDATTALFLENLRRFWNGQPLQGAVDLNQQY